MKQRPYPMTVLMIGQIAVGSVLFALAGSAWSRGQWSKNLLGDPVFAVVLFMALLCFLGAYLANLGSRYTAVSGLGVVACTVWLFGKLDPVAAGDVDASLHNLIVATCWLASGLQLALLFPSSLRVLVDPERRWWLQAAREPLVVPVVLNAGDVSLQLVTFDGSETGLFLRANPQDAGWDQPQTLARLVERGDPVELLVQGQAGHSPITLEAEVSRIQTRAEGGYPVGIGVRFLAIEGANYERYLTLLRDAHSTVSSQPSSKRRR